VAQLSSGYSESRAEPLKHVDAFVLDHSLSRARKRHRNIKHAPFDSASGGVGLSSGCLSKGKI
jgi:hypothetical protein